MLRTLVVALAVVAYVFAQDEMLSTTETSVRPEDVTETTPSVPIMPEDATIQTEEEDHMLTGADREYRKVVKGDLETDPKTFRTYIEDARNEEFLSFWHDVSLFSNDTEDAHLLNMVVEIIRGEGLKTEMAFDKPMNPIEAKLDENGEPVDEHIDYIHHYGSLPQTYSDPSVVDALSQLNGDGKALDVVEISDTMHEIGDVIRIKVLGLLGVLEDEKTIDYKLIGIDVHSSFADQINTLEDVESHFPDLLSATRGFFRYYRYPEKLYDIAFDGQYKDADAAMSIVKDRHDQWLNLIKNSTPPKELNTECHQPDAAFPANDEQWKSIVESS